MKKNKENLFKLKNSLYFDEDGETTYPYRWDEYSQLLAKKGQLAERFKLTDELREEYGIHDKMWQYIWIFNSGCKWVLTQDEECEDFVKV